MAVPPRIRTAATAAALLCVALVPATAGPRTRSVARPVPCSTNFPGTPAPQYFVGITAGSPGDVAGGNLSAVAGGKANAVCNAYSSIGAGSTNQISAGHGTGFDSGIGAGLNNFVDGDAENAFVAAGESNTITGSNSFIGAGSNNMLASGDAFIGAGLYNTETASEEAFIGAGVANTVSGNGSFIGAGGMLHMNACGCYTGGNAVSGADSFIGAGDQNSNAALEAFIGSGASNSISSTASYASILGGSSNSVSGEYASVLGGYGNVASGAYAIVAGGDANSAAGTVSFAAGYHAAATHGGSFVWSDYSSGSATIKDTATNQFVVRASGGTYLFSNEAATAGVALTPNSGVWASLSDRNAKTGVVPVDGASILAEVAALPIDSWRYASEQGVRHAGPMAQDFYATFGVGADDRHIASIDENGVALSAIKALHAERRRFSADRSQLLARSAALEGEFDALARQKRAEIAALRERIRALDEARVRGESRASGPAL